MFGGLVGAMELEAVEDGSTELEGGGFPGPGAYGV